MANIPDILNNLNQVKSNPNNNSFIGLMQDIAGNPNDNIDPTGDPNSLVGKLTEMYNTILEGRGTDEEVIQVLNSLRNLTATSHTLSSDSIATISLDKDNGILNIGIPKGEKGINGLTPIYKFSYDEETGNLSYEIESLEPTPTEEW